MCVCNTKEYSWVDAKRAVPRLTWEIELYGPSIRPKANHHTTQSKIIIEQMYTFGG